MATDCISPIKFRPQPTLDIRVLDSVHHLVVNLIIPAASFLLYLALNRPEVILLAKLGITGWYPAAGLELACMVGLSPWYAVVFSIAGAVAGVTIYHQPVLSWGTLVGSPLGAIAYALAAYVLRTRLPIDVKMREWRDVRRYLIASLTAEVFAAFTGVACLWADHTIPSGEFWKSTIVWYVGDAIGLFSIGPFILIHLIPWVKNLFVRHSHDSENRTAGSNLTFRGPGVVTLANVCIEVVAFVLLFGLASRTNTFGHFYYLAFIPIIWIAMQEGIGGAVTGLLAMNFGLVASLRISAVSEVALTEVSGIMLVISATGLILGAAVSEKNAIANNLEGRTNFLNSLVENSPFGIAVVNCAGWVELSNPVFNEFFSYRASEYGDHNLLDSILPASLRPDVKEILAQVRLGKKVSKEAIHRDTASGKQLDLELYALPLADNADQDRSFIIFKDISIQVNAATKAQEHSKQMSYWLKEMELRATQISLINEMGSLLQCASTREELYNATAFFATKLFAGRPGGLFIRGKSKDSLELATTWCGPQLNKKRLSTANCWALRLGHPHWSGPQGSAVVCDHLETPTLQETLCVPIVANGEMTGVLSVQTDANRPADADEPASDTRESWLSLAQAAASQIAICLANLDLRETLRQESIRDPLTGLYNRRLLPESLDRELQRASRKGSPLAVLFVDIDHFKRFNDQYGHDAGDYVLQSIAGLFRSHFRFEDLIFRYGGEEFAIVLPDTSIRGAMGRADRLRLAAKDLNLTQRGIQLGSVTISIGIAVAPDHGRSAQELLTWADKGLYLSKTLGRDCVTVASATGAENACEKFM